MTLPSSIAADSPSAPAPADGPSLRPAGNERRPPDTSPENATGAAAASEAPPSSRTPVPTGPRPGDDLGESGSAGANMAPAHRRVWRAASLCVAACLGATAGSVGLGAVETLGWVPRAAPAAQVESPDDLRALKESISQLRGQLKTVGDNVAALRANFNNATSAVTTQLAKITDEVERVERLQSEHRATTATSDTTLAASDTKPAKPSVVEGWVLRAVSHGVALVESRHGALEIEPGDTLPGVGRVHEIKRQAGHWVVVTPKGLIVSARD
jgi:hypothetical protein